MMVQYPMSESQLMKMLNKLSRPAMAIMVKRMQEKVLQIGRGIFANGAPSCCQFNAAASGMVSLYYALTVRLWNGLHVPGILFAAIQTARMTQHTFPKA